MLTKLLLVFALAGGIMFVGPKAYDKYYGSTSIQTEQFVAQVQMPKTENLASTLPYPKTKPAGKTLTLESQNIVVFRGPVTEKSVSDVQSKVLELSHSLSKSTPIYLILNTPGGSVGAGLDLIDFLRAIPQKVHTITLFAASMGFQFAQNMDIRYITPNGTLMSHRARLGGLGGQLDGELESRYKMIKRKVDYLDAIAAKRMDMSVAKYKNMVINEYWVHGFDSVEENAADEMVNIKCGKSLSGTYVQIFQTMFGAVEAEFSQCPLIQAPKRVSFANVKEGKASNLSNLFEAGFNNNQRYVDEYITTGEHDTIFGI